ncbi:MAG: class II aldolase/adducin family protein [Nostoc sp.]|uniref:class II aldolase/adducin family protein n=1 Tax=Nostoc sp. TaxID=1180 RepID=UPI002FF6A827
MKKSEGKRIAQALGRNKAAILRNHGILTVGHSVDEAAWWYIRLEDTAKAQLLAEAVGKPVLIDNHITLKIQQRGGTHQAGWGGFQYLWDEITHDQPDLFDRLGIGHCLSSLSFSSPFSIPTPNFFRRINYAS